MKNRQKAGSQRPAPTPGLEATYGPIFPCVSCHTLNFLPGVVELSRVEVLRGGEARHRFLDMEYVDRNPTLFQQLDLYWVCRRCQESMAKGSMPPLAARNSLPETWSQLPRYLRSLTQPELEMGGLTRVSNFLHSTLQRLIFYVISN